MNPQRRRALAGQLKTLSEHISQAIWMLEEDADCIKALYRLQAIRIALRQAQIELLQDYLERWAEVLVQGNDLGQCKDLLEELPILFSSARKINTAVINHLKGEKI